MGSDASGSSLSCVSSVCGSSGRSESSARRGRCLLVSRLRCGRPGGDSAPAASGLYTSGPARPGRPSISPAPSRSLASAVDERRRPLSLGARSGRLTVRP
ncbi:unnamed protein product [Rangifer tarandus platyrhynchus]|uniref:Uncharacterized protein n=2 Tax=Rangifer tarandus platyrhynchus TaxID=3082113 RepID=A0ABN8XYC5_RANTA|nr:unnamed protein product [Rangifer tarandus platyrhynchus]CAI9713087.1 unnamed protein product [Rangifer tarandus platyrhynchus]